MSRSIAWGNSTRGIDSCDSLTILYHETMAVGAAFAHTPEHDARPPSGCGGRSVGRDNWQWWFNPIEAWSSIEQTQALLVLVLAERATFRLLWGIGKLVGAGLLPLRHN